MADKKIEYKIVLIGNTAVGKTSLFKKLSTKVFTEKNISTIGMDKKTIPVEVEVNENNKKVNKKVDISLIDTAGQERFRAITKTYFKGSDGILLLYDVTNKETFNNVSVWIDSIHEAIGEHKNSKYIIILIGNKTDLIGVNGKEREVTEEEAESFCAEKDLKWGGETSVKAIEYEELLKKFQTYVIQIYEKVGAKEVVSQNKVELDKYKKKEQRGCCN